MENTPLIIGLNSAISEVIQIQYIPPRGAFIPLSKLAVPGSVKIKLFDNTEIMPLKYDMYGSPFISPMIAYKLRMLSDEAYRKGENYYCYTFVTVTYREGTILMPEKYLNSAEYTDYQIRTIDGLNELVNMRNIFKKAYPACQLSKWVIFGEYYLNEFAYVEKLDKKYQVPNLISMHDFEANIKSFSYSPLDCFPKYDDVCPRCMKHFTLDDIKNGNFEFDEGKICHSNCLDEYKTLQNKEQMTNIVYFGYNSNQAHNTFWMYDEIPNEYGCSCKICQRRPWYIFHTCDGDIKIGWRKRVISIEFLNFRDFPVSIFDDQNVTKWEKGIHAWNEENARMYVHRVYEYFHK